MRASTLTAVVASLFVGLLSAVGLRASGLLTSRVAVAQQEIKVLVPATNLLANTLIDTRYVGTRSLTADEIPEFLRNRDKYLPPLPSSADGRVTLRNILANRPIRYDDLQDLERPDPLRGRIAPTMRPVNVEMGKNRSSGGLIVVGDWVDVLLTTEVEWPDGRKSSRTATIAREVRVIVKRNTLYPIVAPMLDGQPIQYMLEANPYRAALIEFAKEKGVLSFALLSSVEQKKLEDRRNLSITGLGGIIAALDPDEAEQHLVDGFVRGAFSVGDEDLSRIFVLKPAPTAAGPITIQRYSGVARQKDVVFDGSGREQDGKDDPPRNFRFRTPDFPDETARTTVASNRTPATTKARSVNIRATSAGTGR